MGSKNIKYVMVKDRLKQFREDHPLWTLDAVILHIQEDWVCMKATICDETERLIASGHAHEHKSNSPTNRTSMVENCETSAWGRVLANIGYGLEQGVASAEEMSKVDQSYTGTPAQKQMLTRILNMNGVTNKEQAIHIQEQIIKESIPADESSLLRFIRNLLAND